MDLPVLERHRLTLSTAGIGDELSTAKAVHAATAL